MLENFFKSEKKSLKKTNIVLRDDIEDYKELIEQKNKEIECLRDKLTKENFSEKKLINILTSQYGWDFDYLMFNSIHVGDYFKVTLTKKQKIHKREEISKLFFD